MTKKQYLLSVLAAAIFLILAVILFEKGTATASNNCTSVVPGGNFSVSSSWTGCSNTTPATGDSITVVSGAPITLTTSTTIAGVTINSGGILHGGAFLLTDTGNYTNNGTHDGTGGLLLSGTGATIDGSGTVSNTSSTTLTGNKTVASSASTTFSGALIISTGATITQGGSIAVVGTTTVTGTVNNNATFTDGGSLIGAGSWTQGANATLNCTGAAANAMAVTTTDFHTNPGNTVNYNGATQTLKATVYQNLTFSAAGTKTPTSVTTVSGNFTASAGTATVVFTTVGGQFIVSGGTITTGANMVVTATTTVSSGALTQGSFTYAESAGLKVSGGTFTTGAAGLTVSSTTEISGGTFTNSQSTGSKIFTGTVTVDGGTLNGTGSSFIFNSGITRTSGSVAITGTATFPVNTQALNGTMSITTLAASSSVGLTNNGTLTVTTLTNSSTVAMINAGTITASAMTIATGSTLTNNGVITTSGVFTVNGAVTNNATTTANSTLTGSGSWTQGQNSILNLGGATTNAFNITTIDSHTNVNTVNYNLLGKQNCAVTQYDNLILSGNNTKTCTPSTPILGNLEYDGGGGAWTLTATSTVNGNLTITSGTFTTGAVPFTVNGTTTVSGAGVLTMPAGVGNKTFLGPVNINGGTLSGASPSVFFLNGITQTSGSVAITGTATFQTNSQALNGTMSITTLTASSSITLTNNGVLTATTFLASSSAAYDNEGTSTITTLTVASGSSLLNDNILTTSGVFTVSGSVINNGTTTAASTLTGLGSWVQDASSTLNCAGATTNAMGVKTVDFHTNADNTVNYNGGAQTFATTTYQDLISSVTGAKTISGNISVMENLTVSNGTVTTGAFPFNVFGTTEVSGGTLTIPTGAGSRIFTGLITLDGGTLSGAGTSTILDAGILNNAGVVSLSGSSTILNTGVTFGGSNPISIGAVIVSSTDSVINSGTVNVSSTLSGNGSWTQGSGSVLTLPLAATSIISVGTFDAHTYPNTVTYNGGSQTCLVTQYQNLSFGGGGTKICIPSSAVLGNLAYNATGTWILGAALAVDGNFTISTGTVDVKSSNNYPVTLSGNYANTGGVFNTESDTVTLNGTSTQTFSGAMTGSSDFYNLTITNHSGTAPANCGLSGFTPSVEFLNSVTVENNYTITTGGVGVEYDDASTYTFNNTDWTGPPSQPIYFRDDGSGTYTFQVTGAQTPLAYVNVSQSDASLGNAITAASITNIDCGSNVNWSFGAAFGSPILYTQAAYQLYANQDSSQVGPTLAAANASATLAAAGEAFRLRMLIAVDASGSVANTDSFVLQFANKGTGASCAAPQFPYQIITSSTNIAYNINPSVSNASAMTSTSTDPSDAGRAYLEQTYQSAAPFNVTSTIPAGEDGNWDFSLIDNGSPGGTDYCFEATFANGAALYAYTVYPEIITTPSPNPILSNVVMNNGNADITLIPGSTMTIVIVASTSDPGGPGNISYATSTIYRTSLGSNCTANNLNCYQIPSSSCVFTGSSSTVTCSANISYFAQSTGYPSSSYPSDSWTGVISMTDGVGNKTFATSNAANVDVLLALGVTPSSINYGTITPSSTTGSTNQLTTVQNFGNASMTVQLAGTALLHGASFIATSSQHYATSTFSFGGTEQSLLNSATTVSGLSLPAPTTTVAVQKNVYWGLAVPNGEPTGTYSGTTIFSALFSN